MTYDALIAGASFAGLAVAAQLRGKRVLLLDCKPLGPGVGARPAYWYWHRTELSLRNAGLHPAGPGTGRRHPADPRPSGDPYPGSHLCLSGGRALLYL